MNAEGANNPGSALAAEARAAAAPPLAVEADAAALAQAYEYCARVARSHYENFTVASWLMPRAMRKHMHAIYTYARMADDFRAIRAALDAFNPDLVLIWGDDQYPA